MTPLESTDINCDNRFISQASKEIIPRFDIFILFTLTTPLLYHQNKALSTPRFNQYRDNSPEHLYTP